MTEHQKEILSRLPKDTPLKGVEVGVWRGETSFELLSKRPELHLVLIDPWKTGTPGTDWHNSSSTMPGRPQEDYDRAFARTKSRLTYFEVDNRFTIHRDESLNVVDQFKDESLDFVFLDGDHSYETVSKEIPAWLTKVKVGGWIGGHDYGNRCGDVKSAVDDFFDFVEKSVELGLGHTWFHKIN